MIGIFHIRRKLQIEYSRRRSR